MRYLLTFLICFNCCAQINSASDFEAYHESIRQFWLDSDEALRLNPIGEGPPIDNENPNLFTGQYMMLVKLRGFMKGSLKEEIQDWALRMIEAIEIEEGLYNRRPGDFSRHFSRDEQFGLTYMDFATEGRANTCLALREYGKANRWSYDNRGGQPIRALRQPEFIEYIRLCSNRRTNILGLLSMITSLQVTASRPRGETSGKIMAVLRLETLRGRSPRLLKEARSSFYKKMRDQYGPSFLQTMYKIYFKNTHHPLTTLSAGLNLAD